MALLLGLAACGSSSEPTATYDGDGCTYDGPDEFDLNAEVTFTFVDAVEEPGVGFGVWALPEGMTVEEIRDQGIMNNGAQIAESAAEITDSGILLTYTFDSAGLYAVNCAAAVDHATLFTVSE
jgi:hypothetical protein